MKRAGRDWAGSSLRASRRPSTQSPVTPSCGGSSGADFAAVWYIVSLTESSMRWRTTSSPRTDVDITTEATENAEWVKPGVRPVPSVVSVRSVVQCRV